MFEWNIQAPQVSVETSSFGGHPPEFWAQRAVDRIMAVADTAPMPIREQAKAFKEQMRQVILDHMKRAIASDRTTLKHIVSEAGRADLCNDLTFRGT